MVTRADLDKLKGMTIDDNMLDQLFGPEPIQAKNAVVGKIYRRHGFKVDYICVWDARGDRRFACVSELQRFLPDELIYEQR